MFKLHIIQAIRLDRSLDFISIIFHRNPDRDVIPVGVCSRYDVNC